MLWQKKYQVTDEDGITAFVRCNFEIGFLHGFGHVYRTIEKRKDV